VFFFSVTLQRASVLTAQRRPYAQTKIPGIAAGVLHSLHIVLNRWTSKSIPPLLALGLFVVLA
jgi:hypothetical protein